MVTVIIPALNEEGTIGSVIHACLSSPLVSEVIVVDDGSTDQTASVASREGAIVLVHPENLGKARALFTGVNQAKEEVILCLDADLIGLGTRHVQALVEPVLFGKQDASLGLFSQGRFRTDLAHWLTPNLSGQRCLKKDFLLSLESYASVRYGIEIVITKALKREGKTQVKVKLDHVTHRMKEEKTGRDKGFLKRMSMYFDILRELCRRTKKM